MKTAGWLISFIILTQFTNAQFPDKFYIGAFWVGGNAPNAWCENPGEVLNLDNYIRSVFDDSLAIGLPTSQTLPRDRFRQMQDLGLNMGGIHFGNNSVMGDGDDEVVANVNRTLELSMTTPTNAENIDVCAFTWMTDDAAQVDRIMIHPEATSDLEDKTGSSPDDYVSTVFGDFDHVGRNRLNLSRSIDNPGSGNNCVLFKSPCSVSGLTFPRKREFSAFHTSTLTDRSIELNSGRYQVSVILMPYTTELNPPDITDPSVLTIRIIAADSALSVSSSSVVLRTMEWHVPGSAFYESGVLRTAPFEYHVADPINHGCIEFHVDMYSATDSVLTINNPANHWDYTGSVLTNRLGYWTELNGGFGDQGVAGNLDIQLIASTDRDFYVDAVCLSSQRAYALFASSDATNVFPEHVDALDELERFIHNLTLYDDGTRLSRVTLISLPEQDPYPGRWRSTRLVQRIMHDFTDDGFGNPTCMGYSPKGSAMAALDMPGLVEYQKGMVSGYYAYSVDNDYPRWNQSPEPDDYYNYMYFGSDLLQRGRMWKNVTDYRRYAAEKLNIGNLSPWIPFVQNHGNNWLSNWDNDTLREPNAAELRLMCNIALEHGAKGVMFYQFNSHGTNPSLVPGLDVLWPRDRAEYNADSTRLLNQPFGTIGFLGVDENPRVVDVNGENKWDSTRHYIHTFLRPIGERLLPMNWERSKSWYTLANCAACEYGTSDFVSGINTWQMGASGNNVDDQQMTLVESAEFRGAGDTAFVFLVNARTHKEGQRHVSIKLRPQSGEYQWKVTDLRNGDIHIVSPIEIPDTSSIHEGMTLYLDAGEAVLLKLEPMEDDNIDIDGCMASNIYVWRNANCFTTSGQELRFEATSGIFVEGTFITAPGTKLGPCTESWLGVYSRNGGDVQLNTTRITSGGVNVGPTSNAVLSDGCELLSCIYGLTNLGGVLESYATNANQCYMYLYQTDGTTILEGDSVESWGAGQLLQYYSIVTTGGDLFLRRVRLLNQHRGIYATNTALVYAGTPGNFLSPKNKIICDNWALNADNGAMIVAGIKSGGDYYYADNMFKLLINANWYNWPGNQVFHARDGGGSYIAAMWNYWEDNAPQGLLDPALTSGYVDWMPHNPDNQVPFTGSKSLESFISKSGLDNAASYLPNDHAKQVLAKLAVNDTAGCRNAFGTLVALNALTNAPVHQLNALARIKLAHTQGNVQGLITVLDNRSDLQSKLVLSSLLHGEGLYEEALSTLYAYGFGGANSVSRDALVQKAMLYAKDRRYGYSMGCDAIDSLRAQLAQDSLFARFVEVYPYLYSHLEQPNSHSMPKANNNGYRLDVPDGYELLPTYPNPSSGLAYVTFRVPEVVSGHLRVYNVLGALMAEHSFEQVGKGTHTIPLNTGTWDSGAYIYRLTMGDHMLTGKLLLAR